MKSTASDPRLQHRIHMNSVVVDSVPPRAFLDDFLPLQDRTILDKMPKNVTFSKIPRNCATETQMYPGIVGCHALSCYLLLILNFDRPKSSSDSAPVLSGSSPLKIAKGTTYDQILVPLITHSGNKLTSFSATLALTLAIDLDAETRLTALSTGCGAR